MRGEGGFVYKIFPLVELGVGKKEVPFAIAEEGFNFASDSWRLWGMWRGWSFQSAWDSQN